MINPIPAHKIRPNLRLLIEEVSSSDPRVGSRFTIVILSQRTEVDHQSQRRNESISQRDARVSARPPVVWAALLALVLILFNQHFPASIEDSLRLLGSATGGVALFASGIVLFLRRVAFNLSVGVAVIARNIVIPAVI